MIYIASPYSHTDRAVRQQRYEKVFRYTANLKMQGVVCFSPIVYGHQFHEAGHMPINFEAWQAFNDHMLLAATSMHVLRLPGFDTSAGVKHEVVFADRHGIPVRYITP